MEDHQTYDDIPVVFLSVFEHNSNLLPWRESGAKIEMIPLTDDGDFDYVYLQEKLKSYKG
jgi:selenocysteine lyase/cysteine desulfurase